MSKKQKQIESTDNGLYTLLPTVYPLIDNKRWYAENGTVYNEADEDFRILMVCGENSEMNLPNDVAEKIAEYLNGR